MFIRQIKVSIKSTVIFSAGIKYYMYVCDLFCDVSNFAWPT